jgi:uncharacterized protein (DUF433 family)
MNTTPCAFCGHPDHQHRVRDAILGRRQAGESLESLAHDYGETVEAIEAMCQQAIEEQRDERRRRRGRHT